MTQDAVGREMKVAEIEALVMPAILERRFHIQYAQAPVAGHPGAATLQPVRVQLFAVDSPGVMAESAVFAIRGIG